MSGDLIVVRGFNGPAIVRVWREREGIIEVLGLSEYSDALASGKLAVWPIGIHRADAFKCDAEAQAAMAKDRVDWSKLVKY